MIEVQNLYKEFDGVQVLKNISTMFEDGKTNLIIGQSGSGKTVLMKNLVGLFEPTSGQILYDGRDFVKMSKQEKVLMRREMGMIFQSAALFVPARYVLVDDTPRAHQAGYGLSGPCQPGGR